MLTILLYDYQSIIKHEIYLESVYTPKGYRGFESLSFRKKGVNQRITWLTPFSFSAY